MLFIVDWRLCDDSRVSAISHEKNVVTRAAYLLFYRRREVFIPPPTAGPDEENLDQPDQGIVDDDDDDDNDFESVNSEASRQSDSSDAGELIIDASAGDMELPDLHVEEPAETFIDNRKPVGDVPVIVLDEDTDLGYTDMDSVD